MDNVTIFINFTDQMMDKPLVRKYSITMSFKPIGQSRVMIKIKQDCVTKFLGNVLIKD